MFGTAAVDRRRFQHLSCEQSDSGKCCCGIGLRGHLVLDARVNRSQELVWERDGAVQLLHFTGDICSNIILLAFSQAWCLNCFSF